MAETETRMKPIIIVPPGEMTPADIQELRANGLCVVEAKDPSAVKFLDPIPSAADRTRVEDAAIALSRKILNKGFWTNDSTRAEMARAYVDLLMKGTRLDPEPTRTEKEQELISLVRRNELDRLTREEVREERKAAREAKKAAAEKAAAQSKDGKAPTAQPK